MGHSDSSKTTADRLAGTIGQKTLPQKVEQMGKGDFHFAWPLDNPKTEQERGVTPNLRLLQFLTQKHNITIIDADHKNFIENMKTGTIHAGAAVLFSSAKKDEFETCISTDGQTREYALLAFTLGIRQLIVAINKMDDSTANWNKDRMLMDQITV